VGRLPDEDGKDPYIRSRPEDVPIAILQASTRDLLYLFTAEGTAVALPVHQLPVGRSWEGEGGELATLTGLAEEELVSALALPHSAPDGAFFFVTARGEVKRLLPAAVPGVGLPPTIIMRLAENDWLVDVEWVQDDDEVIIGSTAGQGIRFALNEVRMMGAEAGGVIGIRLGADAVVVGAAVVRQWVKLATITDRGVAKRTALEEFPRQRRSGKGIQIAKLGPDERLMGIGMVLTTSHLIPVTERGAAKTTTGRLSPEQGRTTHGELIIVLQGEDKVAGMLIPQARVEEVKEKG
ncbi:MAG TPA: hypothetical protein G4N98_03100, partial [Thermoflexia bacterium]|nr:hypothetical protein [Thermoflexia bacterium]